MNEDDATGGGDVDADDENVSIGRGSSDNPFEEKMKRKRELHETNLLPKTGGLAQLVFRCLPRWLLGH